RLQQAVIELFVPDAVLRLFAAGVGLLAMAVPKAGIDPQRDLPPRRALAELIDHVGRAAVGVDVVLHYQVQRFAIEDVGRVDDPRRVTPRREPRLERAADLACAHG